MERTLKKTRLYKHIKYYKAGKKLLNNSTYRAVQEKTKNEIEKKISRTEIINFLLSQFNGETNYLEIGVRNPDHNFSKINSKIKYSVDPGIESDLNPADFKMTSDVFFSNLDRNKILQNDIRFDVIFVDGLHLAEQVHKDIINALKYLKEDGFIVLHDCNPPTEWHAREDYNYRETPAKGYWNGTTWKAFLKYRFDNPIKSCCIDTDWGVGIISKKYPIGKEINSQNMFFEYATFNENRTDMLNLIPFTDFKKKISKTIHNA